MLAVIIVVDCFVALLHIMKYFCVATTGIYSVVASLGTQDCLLACKTKYFEIL